MWQAFILRGHRRAAGWWIVGSAVSWTFAAGTVAVADSLSKAQSLHGVVGALEYLAIFLSGGVVLGLVTGVPLVHLRSRETVSDN